jgi:hypothetical protein
MADSKPSKLCDSGLMVAAMAYRVKYRRVGMDGKARKIPVRIESMGVHRKNRGGMYPAGLRCKSLGVTVLEAGFLKEEVNHAFIVVEEAPVEEILLRATAADRESSSSYNAEHSMKDELLSTCFQPPYDDVRHTLLSHNHIMLVLRAFLSQAKWDLPAVAEKNLTFCDSEGRLSITAVADSPNGKELAEVMQEGIQAEVLSWKMDVEQPDAAAIISQAQNLPQDVGMRTTELTAVAVLKGEIIVQMGKDLSQRVAFQTVRDRVRSQLHTAADDPDLPEVFDFLISNGVGRNAYIEHMLEWTSSYVDSKKRQLRFSAFAVINKMCERAVWSKVAVVKRAYRKPPINGFCPSPEISWGDYGWDHMQKLEDILRFFHGSCKSLVDKLKPHSRIQLLGNIDIAATEAFYGAKNAKLKEVQKIEEILLTGTKKYMVQLGGDATEETMKKLLGRAEWIVFKEDAATDARQPTEAKIDNAPHVIHFDELTGKQLITQVEILAAPEKSIKTEQLPWRTWYSGIGQDMGVTEANQAAAVAVLHSIHQTYDVSKEPVEVWRHGNNIYVTTNRKLKPFEIMLPPCIPRQSKVLEKSEHPYTVQIKIAMRRTGDGVYDPKDVSNEKQKFTYFVNPEFKLPRKDEVQTAVAGAAGSGDGQDDEEEEDDDAAVADEWVWGTSDSMHPFWAVRRMTQKNLLKEINSAQGSKNMIPRFNCKMEVQVMSCVSVGVVNSRSLNTTRICEVPFMTNFFEVEKGEELIMEILEKEKGEKVPAKRTWKQAFNDEEKLEKAAKLMKKK